MACNITKGRAEFCKDAVAGLQGIYFQIFDDATGYTYNTSGEFSGFTAGSTVYYYELKGTSNYNESVTTSRDNGTTFYTQTLLVNLKKLTNDMSTQLKLMAYGRNKIFIHTNNGDTLLVGKLRGMDMTAGSLATGSAMGDLYGYSLTFTGMEPESAVFVAGSTIDNPFAGVANAPTIVRS